LPRIVETFTRRGVAVVISDFFTTNGALVELLRQLQAQRQETVVFHLLAPEEFDLPYDGDYLFEDCETSEELPVHVDAFREEYQKRLQTFCADLKTECIRLEADYQQIRTDAPLDIALTAYLERRASV
jgi:hypothetical protein